MNILFIGPIPPPVTGQSLACKVLLDAIKISGSAEVVNLSKSEFKQGVSSLRRVVEVLVIAKKIFFAKSNKDLIYFTISESIFGNLKDLIIYAICFKRLHLMVVHLHGGAGMRHIISNEHPILKWLNIFFLKRVAAIIVLGGRLEGIFDALNAQERLFSVPNFALDDFFLKQNNIVAKFNDDRILRILFLSNLLPGKGHVELLEAIRLLPQRFFQKIRFDFAGGFESSSEETNFKKQVNSIKGFDIVVHGIVHGEEKKRLLAQAHLFCLPTYYPYEGQPISILEAYASGCAVLTTDHSGIFDVFTPGVNGFQVEKGSPGSIARAIEESLLKRDQTLKYAIANSLEAEKKYRLSTHIHNMLTIFNNVVYDNSGGHRCQ